MAMLIEEAGGIATTGSRPIMEILPTGVHARVPCICKSFDLLKDVGFASIVSTHRFLFSQWEAKKTSKSSKVTTRNPSRENESVLDAKCNPPFSVFPRSRAASSSLNSKNKSQSTTARSAYKHYEFIDCHGFCVTSDKHALLII